MSTQRKDIAVRETVISFLETDRLKKVSTRQLMKFKCLRGLYEKQIEENARHLKEDEGPLPLRAFIEDDDLDIFIAAEWVDAPSTEKVTEGRFCHR